MTKLSGTFDVSAPRSELPSTATVDMSGVADALKNIGQAVDRYDAHQDQEADKTAAVHVGQAMTDYAPAAAQRQVEHGDDPDYASQEIKAFDDATKDYRNAPDLSPRVRKALGRQLDTARLHVSDAAIGVSAARAGQLEGQRRAALELTDDTAVTTQLLPQVSDAIAQVRNNWDGKSAGYATGVKQAYDATTKAALDALPEAQRLRLMPGIVAQGNAYFAQAMTQERTGQDAYVVDTAHTAADTAVNLVTTDPGNFDQALVMVDQAAGALPAPLQSAYRKDAGTQLVMARFSGLIAGGQADTVKAELPTYQKNLSPDDYARVTAALARDAEKKQATDYVAQAALQSRSSAYLDSLVTGAAQERPSDAEIEATSGQEGLFKFRQEEQLRKDAVVAMGDFSSLPADRMDQRLADQQALVDKGGPDYDRNVQVLGMMQKAAGAQEQARRADPAAWAMSGDGTAQDPSQAARRFWEAAREAPNAQSRAFSLATYADATTARQTWAGVADPKLLPVDTAKAMIAPLTDAVDDKARGDAIMGLMSNVQDWGANGGRIVGELRAAGLGSEQALLIGEMGDNPLIARAYAAGGTEWKAKKTKDQDAMIAQVQKQLGPMDATLVAGAGSPQARTDRYNVLAKAAAGYMAAGESQDHAIQHATQDYRDKYSFQSTYRVPANIGNGVYSGITDSKSGMGVTNVKGTKMIGLALGYVMSDIDGAPGRTKGAVLSDNTDIARRTWATIQAQGRWVTRDDDSGVQLMIPDQAGGAWVTIKNKFGKPLSYSWGELQARARYPDGKRPNFGPNAAPGMVQRGNIDLDKRPVVQNADGTYSTVRSISVEMDGKTYLLPTVVGNKVVSNDEAIKHFKKTGEHLGVFQDGYTADQYAKTLHEQQAKQYGGH